MSSNCVSHGPPEHHCRAMSSHLVLPSHSKYLQTGYQHLSSSINHCLHHLRWFELIWDISAMYNVKQCQNIERNVSSDQYTWIKRLCQDFTVDFTDLAQGCPRHQTSVWRDALGRRSLGRPVHIGSEFWLLMTSDFPKKISQAPPDGFARTRERRRPQLGFPCLASCQSCGARYVAEPGIRQRSSPLQRVLWEVIEVHAQNTSLGNKIILESLGISNFDLSLQVRNAAERHFLSHGLYEAPQKKVRSHFLRPTRNGVAKLWMFALTLTAK